MWHLTTDNCTIINTLTAKVKKCRKIDKHCFDRQEIGQGISKHIYARNKAKIFGRVSTMATRYVQCNVVVDNGRRAISSIKPKTDCCIFHPTAAAFHLIVVCREKIKDIRGDVRLQM